MLEGIRDRGLEMLLIHHRQVLAQLAARRSDRHLHHVARDLEVARSLGGQDLRDHAIDLVCCDRGVRQDGLRDGQLLEDCKLRVEVLDLVVKHHVAGPLPQPGSAGDDEQRHLLRPRPCHRIGDLQSANAVRDRNDAKPPEAGIGIRGEGCALLVSRDLDVEAVFLEVGEEAQGIVTDDAETELDTALAQALGKVQRDGELVGHGRQVRAYASSSGWGPSGPSATDVFAPAIQPTKRRP